MTIPPKPRGYLDELLRQWDIQEAKARAQDAEDAEIQRLIDRRKTGNDLLSTIEAVWDVLAARGAAPAATPVAPAGGLPRAPTPVLPGAAASGPPQPPLRPDASRRGAGPAAGMADLRPLRSPEPPPGLAPWGRPGGSRSPLLPDNVAPRHVGDSSATMNPKTPAFKASWPRLDTAASADEWPGDAPRAAARPTAAAPGQLAQQASPPAGAPPRRGPSATGPCDRAPLPEFRQAIAKAEGSYDKGNDGYGEANPTGAFGRYQLRRGILKDAGWLEMAPGDRWTAKARQNGVASFSDLLKNPAAQEAAMTDAMKAYEAQASARGLFSRIGQVIQGLEGPIMVSEAGIIAASHREGATGVANYFKMLDAFGGDSKAANLDEKLKAIETRLRTFQHVPYQRITAPRRQP